MVTIHELKYFKPKFFSENEGLDVFLFSV